MKQLIKSENLKHLLAGDTEIKGASFTVLSKATGKDFTFKVARNNFQDRMYTHIKVEQGYLDFSRIGTYSNGIIKNKGQEINTPAAQAAAWLLRQIERERFNVVDEKVEICHLGKCLRCGRTLTDSHSIETGFGPHCRGRLN